MMEYRFIKIVKEKHVGKLILSRSAKRNAFTPTMVNEIYHAFQYFNNDDTVKIVMIEAEGPVFCAGMDLKTFEDPLLDDSNPYIVNENISLGEVFDSLLKPSIALVEGDVIAGGFLIILGCTYVFCKAKVKYKLPEFDLGIFPFQVMASLLKVMPEKKVLQLCLETEFFNSQRAIELGIVDGFIDVTQIEKIINSFEDKSTKVIKAGIKALRTLPDINKEDRFSYLKAVLDGLRDH